MSYSKIIMTLFLIVPSTICMMGQAPSIEWQINLGGTSSDEVRSMQKTSDGGYIIAGFTKSNDGDVTVNKGGFDYWVVKLDGAGSLEWQKTYGGSNSEIAQSIQQTSDGGYIVAGRTNSNDGDVTGNKGELDYWVLKLDGTGNIEWQKTYGGSNTDRANSIQQTDDGGYVIAGNTESNDGDITGKKENTDCWVVKLDSFGNIEWQKALGGNEIDRANSIKQSEDGGYVIAGMTNSNDGDITGNKGHFDYWVVKLDGSGNIEWQKTMGGSSTDGALSIQQTSDKGYAVAGLTRSNDGDVTDNIGGFDYWVVKLNGSGNIEWQKTLGGNSDETAISIQQSQEGGYILTGQTSSFNGDVTGNNGEVDYWTVKLDESGSIEWQKTLGGSEFDRAYSVVQSEDGSYTIAGMSESNDGDVVDNNGALDYWIVKLSNVTSVNQDRTVEILKVFPNPTESEIHIQLAIDLFNVRYSILDMKGVVVREGKLNGNNLNVENLIEGTYILKLVTDNTTYQSGFIKQ